jgi:uncharacterized LabA/DUF88 family protein
MKVQVFIDGGNFHHLALRPLGLKEKDFDFDSFAEFIADGRDISDLGKRYYVGTVREREGDERSKEAMSKQVQFFNELKKTAWQIKTSKLRERNERIVIDVRVNDYKNIIKSGIREIFYKTYREKGIDVKIATDLAAATIDKKCDAAIIVSSDTDLVPMIDWVRYRFKQKVEYVGFSIPDKSGRGNDIRPTQSLISRSDVQRVLVESDIRKFIKQIEKAE